MTRTLAKLLPAALLLAACGKAPAPAAASRPASTQPAVTLTYELPPAPDINKAVEFTRIRLSAFFLPEEDVQAAGANRIAVTLPAKFPLTPADVDALLLPHGPLEFRVAVAPESMPDDARHGLDAADDSPQHIAGLEVRWVRVADGAASEFDALGTFITRTTADGQLWLLCHDDPASVIICDDGEVDASVPYLDHDTFYLPINFAAKTAKKMGVLTGDNLGHPLIIIYDHRALTGPNLNGHISGAAVITFGNSKHANRHDAEMLKASLDSASLPQLPFHRVP